MGQVAGTTNETDGFQSEVGQALGEVRRYRRIFERASKIKERARPKQTQRPPLPSRRQPKREMGTAQRLTPQVGRHHSMCRPLLHFCN